MRGERRKRRSAAKKAHPVSRKVTEIALCNSGEKDGPIAGRGEKMTRMREKKKKKGNKSPPHGVALRCLAGKKQWDAKDNLRGTSRKLSPTTTEKKKI